MNSKKESSKKLAKNIGFLSISQFSTKILTFFLLPLYTSVLSTSEYGIYDFFTTTIGLIIPILTLHIVESILRFSLDKNQSPTAVFTNGIYIICRGFCVFTILIIINYVFNFLPFLNEYLPYFILMFVTDVAFQTLSNFSRGIDKVLSISIAGIISTVVVITSNILLLLIMRAGFIGYIAATIFGNLSAIVFLSLNLRVWNYINPKSVDSTLRREMVSYSLPLILNQISWWINNASDRYIVIALCGIAANGVYSIGYKIPNILNTFQSIFNSSWVLSTVQDYDKNDSNGFFSSTYEKYNSLMVIICSLIIALTRIIAKILYAKDFFDAWRFVPFLTLAVVFGAMSGYLGGIFSAVKDTKTISLTTILGAAINILLNFLLVRIVGPLGAAIATTISCYAIYKIRYIISRKYISLSVHGIRNEFSYAMLMAQSFLMLLVSGQVRYYLQVFCVLIVLGIYHEEALSFMKLIFFSIRSLPKKEM